MKHQHLVSFFAEHPKRSTSLAFLSIKIALAAPKIIYLENFKKISFLSYGHSIKGINQGSKITVTNASVVLKLSASYTDP